MAVVHKPRGLVDGRLIKGWYVAAWDDVVDPKLPGIYEWRIADEAVYIGQARSAARRSRSYANNVRRLLAELPYHIPTRNYRAVHHALANAYIAAQPVMVRLLENCPLANLNERERWWIDQRRCEETAGGLRVLNSN